MGRQQSRKHPRKKHGVSFADAATAFEDLNAMIKHDDRHDEDRFVLIGMSVAGLVVVVFVERDEDTTRIISARKATKKERKEYEEGI